MDSIAGWCFKGRKGKWAASGECPHSALHCIMTWACCAVSSATAGGVAFRSQVVTQVELDMSDYFSPEQVTEFSEVFNLFDKNGDHTIAAHELGTVMRSLGQNPTEAELQEAVREADGDATGFVAFKAFLSVMEAAARKLEAANQDEEVLAAFKVFDVDGDGKISAAELRFALTRIGETLSMEEAKEMIAEAGMDEEGRIDYVKYVKTMKQV